MNQITINFFNVTLASSTCSILLNDGSYDLDSSEGLSISGTFSFTAMQVTAGAISFNVASGTPFNGSVVASVAMTTPGAPPSIEVTNFSGIVTVSWPTNGGIETQTLASGNPITLSGYAG